jgi:hypothetical protein
VLMIAGRNHDGVQIGIGEHRLGILKRLRPFPKQLLSVVGGSLAIHRPEVTDAAQVEVRVRLGGHLEHLPVARRSMPAADQADLDPIIRADNSRVRSCGEQQRSCCEEVPA